MQKFLTKDCSNLVSNGNIALAVHATFANFHFSSVTRTYSYSPYHLTYCFTVETTPNDIPRKFCICGIRRPENPKRSWKN